MSPSVRRLIPPLAIAFAFAGPAIAIPPIAEHADAPLATASADPASAGADLADANVVSVVTAHWPSGASATVRIVSLTHGFEHVSSSVVAQWMTVDDRGDWRLASSQVLVPAGMSSLQPPAVTVQGDAVRVALEGRHSYQPDRIVRCEFLLAADGEVRSVRPCGD